MGASGLFCPVEALEKFVRIRSWAFCVAASLKMSIGVGTDDTSGNVYRQRIGYHLSLIHIYYEYSNLQRLWIANIHA